MLYSNDSGTDGERNAVSVVVLVFQFFLWKENDDKRRTLIIES